jgi:CheY-like chemotaxis protein
MSKRALIVDDSRSARVILTRMLEGYGLAVDSSESAEQALEHLKQSRPDVIFMDHLMPGMDGFQAIAAIKGNPETSMIPVVMYTSQEGDLYLSQARALGAVGVLPKTVKQSDVSRVLYQLRLLPERREARPQLIAQAAGHDMAGVQVEPPPKPTVGEIETAIRAAMAPVLKEHAAELRRFMVASLDAFARRVGGEARQEPAPAVPAPETAPTVEQPQAAPPNRWPLAAAVAALALLPTLFLGVLYTRTLQSTQSLMQSNARLAAVVEEQQAQLASIQQSMQNHTAAPTPAAAHASAETASEPVPYGEAPLSGARLERLRTILDGLKASGFRGRLKVATYVGEFCLTGNGIEGYSMAADDLPARRCDLRGNPFDDSLTAAQRQSLAFANLVSSVRQDLGDAVTIDVAHLGRQPLTPYPNSEQLPALTAGEWNRIAAQNNRVEFAAEPTGT